MAYMLIAVTAMFLQQTCGSIARALPAVLAPLIIAELHADAAWVGIYFSLTAFAGLIGQLGSGGFIFRHGAIRMSRSPCCLQAPVWQWQSSAVPSASLCRP